ASNDAQSKANAAQSAAEATALSYVNSLNIGAVNLIVNSTFNNGFGYWSIPAAYRSILAPQTDKPNSSILRLNYNVGSSLASPCYNVFRRHVDESVPYILSFDFYCANLNAWDGSTAI